MLKTHYLNTAVEAIGEHPWWSLFYSSLLFAAFWWVAVPLFVFAFGQPVQARVMDRWYTNSEVCAFFWCWQVAGMRLEITLPDGQVHQFKKYCRDEVVFSAPLAGETVLDGRYAFWRLVLPDVPCDSEQFFFILTLVLCSGLYPIWVQSRTPDSDSSEQDDAT